MTMRIAVAAALLVGACASQRVREVPIAMNGDRMQTPDSIAGAYRANEAGDRARSVAARDSIAAVAASTCQGAVCAALARGEVALGMSEAQLMASTRTTGDAWSVRRAGGTTVMVARRLDTAPRDVNGELGMIQLVGGQVTTYAYREPQGFRTIASAGDATDQARGKVTADALVREGDAFNAQGQRDLALDRYDRALVFDGDNPMLQYKVATLLDLQLRPQEATMRYQRFLQQMKLQTIKAEGEAAARQAEAIALAQQRIVILQKQSP